MPLSASDKLGPYEILALVGKGGMGEVYRAHDPRLHRDVAIKVANADFTERFTREARAIAALNHTNICHLYDVGPNYLVMEYVEGSDLRGPLAFDDALPLIHQLIDGIEAAHEKGIVHRDLKPANIKITPEGVVKILDFGLAKQNRDSDGAGSDPENSPTLTPTLTMGATQAGAILGTAAYMAPEQAKGKTADKRSDIWSFGVILYELLTGRRLFPGETTIEILGAVLNREPDLSAAPARVHELLRWCLEKDRKKRLASISDARRLLDTSASPSREAGVSNSNASLSAPSQSRFRAVTAVAAVAVLAAAAVSFVHFQETRPTERVLRFTIPLPGGSNVSFLDLSPDGRSVVLGLAAFGKYQLYVRRLESAELRPLSGTENARLPFWSFDGRSIGFFADGKLKTVSANGGPSQTLCTAGSNGGGSWNHEGVIIFSDTNRIMRVRATGGECTPVTKPPIGESQRAPVFLPDGNHFLYAVFRGEEERPGLYVAALDDSNGKLLLRDESSAVYAPPAPGAQLGHLLFLREATLMAQPFQTKTLRMEGDAFAVAGQASQSSTPPQLAAAVSANGTLVYLSGGITNQTFQLTWFDGSGREVGKLGMPGDQRALAFSPDGKTLATSGSLDGIFLRDLARDVTTRFASGPAGSAAARATAPVWSPDGTRIAYTIGIDLFVKLAAGGLPEEPLLKSPNLKRPSDWSRDGHALLYTENNPKTRGDIWVLADPLSTGEHKSIEFLRTDADESQAQFSPDGRWVAYTSDESGRYEVYVRPYPPGPGKWKISVNGGDAPRWSHDGKALFYVVGLENPRRIMAVPVRSISPSQFESGVPKPFLDFRTSTRTPVNNEFVYSPSPDGQRFLVNVYATNVEPTLNVITNWQKAALGK